MRTVTITTETLHDLLVAAREQSDRLWQEADEAPDEWMAKKAEWRAHNIDAAIGVANSALKGVEQ